MLVESLCEESVDFFGNTELEEGMSNNPNSLPLKAIAPEKLCITTSWNVFGSLNCRNIVLVDASYGLQNICRIGHCPTNWAVPHPKLHLLMHLQ